MENFHWCGYYNDFCPNAAIGTLDPVLCQDKIFWTKGEKTCNVGNFKKSPYIIQQYGKRCTGFRQHCYYPWYLSNQIDFEVFIQLFLLLYFTFFKIRKM